MDMEGNISYSLPEPNYWEAYEALWKNSSYQPVFQSPQYIRYLSSLYGDKIARFSFYRNGELGAAVFFWKNGNTFQFLSDFRNDHNFFLIHRTFSQQETEAFFASFLDAVKAEKWMLSLNNQPGWADYMPAFKKAGRDSTLFWEEAYLAPCPMLDGGTPEGVFRRFNKSRNLRYKQNRLIREQDPSFEVFTDATDLDNWIDEYCRVHIQRWQHTKTPSSFENNEEGKLFFKGCMEAWEREKRLVRFSIKIKDVRVAFCIGLIQQEALLYHSLTFDPEYSIYSPGKVLLITIGRWMKENQLKILDFGYGDEDYKFRYANNTPALETFFISSRSNLPFMLKAKLFKLVRENPVLIKTYRQRIKPFVREVIRNVSGR